MKFLIALLATTILVACKKPPENNKPEAAASKEASEAEYQIARICSNGTTVYVHNDKLATFDSTGNGTWIYLKDAVDLKDFC